MKRVGVALVLAVFSVLVTIGISSPKVYADATPAGLIITELKANNDTAPDTGLNEFIEVYNNSDQALDLKDYQFNYFNIYNPDTTTSPTATQVLGSDNDQIDPYQYVVFARVVTQIAGAQQLSLGSALKDAQGCVRLIGPDPDVPLLTKIYDEIAWFDSSASNPLPNGVNKLPAGTQSLQRISNQTDTPVVLSDGWLAEPPTPFSYTYIAPPVIPTDEDQTTDPAGNSDQPADPDQPDETPSVPDQAPVDTTGDQELIPKFPLLPPQITELLPNPAPPQTDSADEFVELYNPNDSSFDLGGYKLQTGNSFSYSFVFSGDSLQPHEYKAFLVTETGDILSNTSGQARLLNPDGATVSQTDPYDTAKDGQAWAFVNSVWQWTIIPTPNAENQLAPPVLKLATAKTATAKKTSTAKASTAKKATAKTASAKATKAAATEREVYEDPEEAPPAIHPGILVGVGTLAVLYAVYEYRYDAVNRLHQFRRYREFRRTARAQAKGR